MGAREDRVTADRVTKGAGSFVVACVALVPTLCAAQGVARTKATLERPEMAVVIEGSLASGMAGVPIAELRLFAWKGDGLKTIPYQIDERDPDELYAYTKGQHLLSDTDDRALDDNDEIVFMARDVGDRIHPQDLPPGCERWVELRVSDARSGGQGWVYLVRFLRPEKRQGPPRESGEAAPRRDPPNRSDKRYVTFEWKGGEKGGELASWRGMAVKIAGHPKTRNFLDFHELRFPDGKGGYGPDVLDQAKLSFKGKYLFLDIRRHMDEMRSRITGFLSGPIRLVASCSIEVYMVWGHWIKTSRGRVKIYGNRLELDIEVDLPVSLETKNKGSEVRFSLDFLPSAGPVHVGSDTNLREIEPKGSLRYGKPPLPRWVYASLQGGSVLARLKLADDLQRPTHKLFLRGDARGDAPEEVEGSHGNTGFELDLTGLKKGTYPLKLILQFGPKLAPGRPEPLLRVDEVPVRSETGRQWTWSPRK